MQPTGTPRPRRLRRSFASGLLLGLFLVLHAAVVVPAVHLLLHQDDVCDQPDCVVLALAQGKVDADSAPVQVTPPPVATTPVALSAVLLPMARPDCPVLPGRAPPV